MMIEGAGDGAARITAEEVSGVCFLTMSNESRANALTRGMVSALESYVDEFEATPDLRVLVLRGAGERFFSAGADLKEMADDEARGIPFSPILPRVFDQLLTLEKPVVAAINGDAVGGGFELALCCDIRVMASHARLGLPEAILGMAPRYGTALVSRVAGIGTALDIAMSGRLYPAHRAYALNLVQNLVSSDSFSVEVDTLAAQLASRPARAIAAIKYIAREAAQRPVQEVVEEPLAQQTFGTGERAAGIASWSQVF